MFIRLRKNYWKNLRLKCFFLASNLTEIKSCKNALKIVTQLRNYTLNNKKINILSETNLN